MWKQENPIKIPFLNLNYKHQVENNLFLILLNGEVFQIYTKSVWEISLKFINKTKKYLENY